MAMENQPKGNCRNGYEWLQILVYSMLSVVLLFAFVVRVMGVSGESMQNTLQDGDRLLVLNGWLCREYRAGDIVIAAKDSFEDGNPVVKRVIAVEGQTVDIDFAAGIVYVDEAALEEPYIKAPTCTEEGLSFPLTLGQGELFLLGDNRNESKDSRHPGLGAVDERCVIGRACFLLTPGVSEASGRREWSRIGILD